ncbi:MAG TPA: glutathionylspermidine synthase family protein [Kofleriaceae bacterium]
MKRCACEPRPDWRQRVEAQGLVFHTTRETGVYWSEGVYYEFTPAEADAIDAATQELHARCLEAVAHVVEHRRYAELGIGERAAAMVEASWRANAPTLYGRMDFAFGEGVPKLLEYNADTPTSVLEAAVIQWTWLDEVRPGLDQQNVLHDKLIGAWRALAPRLPGVVHFACGDDIEDAMTIGYLRDTAEQAGLATRGLMMHQVGWDARTGGLVDLEEQPIAHLFKLYPWEGLVTDKLASVLPSLPVTWLEPPWKLVLSNKAILPILWELFPGHPNLLPAFREPHPSLGSQYVKKPIFSREGANVTIVGVEGATSSGGRYGAEGHVYQTYADLGDFGGVRPVVGGWVVAGESAGIGIRESDGFITSNFARFVPHAIG